MNRNPLYIRMHPADNVAIVANDGGLSAGAVFADGLTLVDKVPQGHKVALRDLAAHMLHLCCCTSAKQQRPEVPGRFSGPILKHRESEVEFGTIHRAAPQRRSR